VAEPLPLRDEAGLPVLAGYEVLEHLGRGPAGISRYRARQLVIQRQVLLEVVFAREDSGQLAWGALRGSAAAMAKVDHPNILQLYEMGERDRQLFYNAVEAVEGPTLAEALQGRPLPAREALALLEALARAVHCAHEKGLVHRSLRPAVVRLQPVDEGTNRKAPHAPAAPPVCRIHGTLYLPKISDWGLARRPVEGDVNDRDLQGEHPSYLSPEQAWGRARDIGPVTDIYALGAIFYECLTGRAPFRGSTPAETLDKVYTAEPPPLSRYRRLPPDVVALARRCLDKQPHRRYNAALQLAADARRCLEGSTILGRRASDSERLRGLVRRTWPALLLLLLGGGLGALIAWLAPSKSARPSSPEARDRGPKHSEAQLVAQVRAREGDYFRRILLAERAVATRDSTTAAALLEGCPPDLRHWEFEYLERRNRGGHHDGLTGDAAWSCLTISNHGEQVAGCGPAARNRFGQYPDAACWNTTVDRLFGDVEALRGPVQTFEEGNGRVRAVAFSPTGYRLALLREQDDSFQIELVRPATRGNGVAFPVLVRGLTCMTYTPDGGRLVLGDRWGKTYLIDAATGRVLVARQAVRGRLDDLGDRSFAHVTPLTRNGDRVVITSPDGRMVLTQYVWEGQEQVVLQRSPPEDVVLALAAHPDTRCIAVGCRDGAVRLLRDGVVRLPHDPNPTLVLSGHRRPVTGIAFSADGWRLFTCSEDGTLKVWDTSSGLEVLTIPISPGTPSALAFGASDSIMAVAHGKQITLIRGQ
jgi:serine/threonine protein kinase